MNTELVWMKHDWLPIRFSVKLRLLFLQWRGVFVESTSVSCIPRRSGLQWPTSERWGWWMGDTLSVFNPLTDKFSSRFCYLTDWLIYPLFIYVFIKYLLIYVFGFEFIFYSIIGLFLFVVYSFIRVLLHWLTDHGASFYLFYWGSFRVLSVKKMFFVTL